MMDWTPIAKRRMGWQDLSHRPAELRAYHNGGSAECTRLSANSTAVGIIREFLAGDEEIVVLVSPSGSLALRRAAPDDDIMLRRRVLARNNRRRLAFVSTGISKIGQVFSIRREGDLILLEEKAASHSE